MKAGWEVKPFPECVEPVRVDRARQIKRGNYLPDGEYPIVDQGQGLIAGWTNKAEAVLKDGLPYIVFGDHTRLFKYIDFPFALGADGTKLISPSSNINPRHFYYALTSLDIPSRGYSRHYGILKEKSIPLPPLPEQKKIAAVLLKLQQAISAQDKIIQSLRDLKKSTMHHLFTHGLRGEQTKMTEIGEIPESWEVVKLGEIANIGAGGTPSRANKQYWQNGSIPWVKTGEINYCWIETTEEQITKEGLKNSAAKLLPSGTLLLAMYGQGITRGKVARLGIEAATNQACAALRPDEGKLQAAFLYAYLTWSYDRLRSLSHGAQQANLNAKIIADFPVALPCKRDQEAIALTLDGLDAKARMHQSKKSALQDLFKTTLKKLMTGDIRVADLDIDVKEVEG
jgi:type I restriction enzyme, S subunit